MTRLSASILFLLIIPLCQAGIFDDVKGVASDVGDFFSNKFNDVKSLFAENQGDLEKNVERVKGLLATITEKMPMLKPLANDAQKAALEKVGQMTTQVDEFQKKLKSGAEGKFEENKSTWEKMVKNMFTTEGLQQVVALLQSKANSASSVFFSLTSFLIPLVLLIRQ